MEEFKTSKISEKTTYQIYNPKTEKVIYEDENPEKVIEQEKSYEKLNKELGIVHELRMVKEGVYLLEIKKLK
ncbi:MAG: hypothetical protein ACE5J7_04040 [Candidatus Aenigmatarchaeota archaeon]